MEGSSLGGEGLVQAGCFQGQKLNGERQQEGEHRRETQERAAGIWKQIVIWNQKDLLDPTCLFLLLFFSHVS